MATHKETVRLLCKSIVTRLENNKSISFPPRLRQIVQDEVHALVGPYILTDEDIKDRAHAKMGLKAEAVQDSGSTESDAFKAAKSVVKGQIGEHELNGFYFQKPLKEIATTIAKYFMRSSHIDDVYETDEDLEKFIIDVVKKFDESNLH
jgi:hypothetical protein